MVGCGGRRIPRHSCHAAWRISDDAGESLRGARCRALRAAGGTGSCVVVLTLYRLEYLSLGAAQPDAPSAGSPNPAADVDRGDASRTHGTPQVISTSPLCTRYA